MLFEAAEAASERLAQAGHVTVVSHIDADGLCSAAIAKRTLEEADVDHEVRFLKTLGTEEMAALLEEDPECVWFVDLGSGMADLFSEKDWVVSDHHTPKARGCEHHLNPHFYGIDGSRHVSGAGMTWAVARHLVEAETEGGLAALAVVGAVGDLQNREDRRLTGVNQGIVGIAAEAGTVAPSRDVSLYGRETRELHRFFQYADDPLIPGVSGSAPGAVQFLVQCEVARRGPDGARSWVHLDHEERSRLCSAAVRRILATGGGHGAARRLFGEVYELPLEPLGTELHDAKEFATLLNSTARYDRADVGLALALGDRDGALTEVNELVRGHRRALVQAVEGVLREGLERMGHLQYFHGGDRIRDTIVGIVAGMVSRRKGVAKDAVMVAFANAEPGFVKVSCRAPKPLVVKGLDLSESVGEAASGVGGQGGGHKGAAGATIPEGREPDFLSYLDGAVGRQLGTRF